MQFLDKEDMCSLYHTCAEFALMIDDFLAPEKTEWNEQMLLRAVQEYQNAVREKIVAAIHEHFDPSSEGSYIRQQCMSNVMPRKRARWAERLFSVQPQIDVLTRQRKVLQCDPLHAPYCGHCIDRKINALASFAYDNWNI
jgi:hypothetical protein